MPDTYRIGGGRTLVRHAPHSGLLQGRLIDSGAHMTKPQTAVVALGVIVAALSLAVRGTAQDAAAAKPESPTLISKAAHVDLDTMIAMVALILSAVGMFWRQHARISLLEAADKRREEAEKTTVTRRECELQHADAQRQFTNLHEELQKIGASIETLTRNLLDGGRR